MTDRDIPQDGLDAVVDNGIRSSDLGSFLPEGTYRPVPIVWLMAAFLLQVFGLIFLFALLSGKPPAFLAATGALVSFGIGYWTFGRGMAEAATGWKILTVLVLLLNWLFVGLPAFA